MRLATILAAVAWVVSVGTVAAPQEPERTKPWAAPAAADARQNPLANRADVVPGGKKVFAQRCGQCHGHDGSGGERGPNLMTRRVQDQTDGAIFWKITSGNTRSGMPTFSLLPELQRWQLVNYLRSDAQDLPK